MSEYESKLLEPPQEPRLLDKPAEERLREELEAEKRKKPKPGRAKPIWIVIGLLLLFIILFFVGYLPRHNREKRLQSSSKQEKESLPVVSAVPVRRSALVSDILLPGNIQAFAEAPILARADGYVKRRYVDIGDRVKAGQLLAELEAPEIDQQVRQAQAAVSQARAALGQAEASVKQDRANEDLASVTAARNRTLVQRGVLSRQEGDQTEAALQAQTANRQAGEAAVVAARENVSAVAANLQRLRDLQSYENVRAPFSGVVTVRNVDTGALITIGNTLLFRVSQIGILRIFVNVPQSNAPEIRVGQKAEILVQEFPRRHFIGRVSRSADALDSNTRTLLTEVQLANTDYALMPGMYAQVKFETTRANPPLLIPGDTLVVRDSKNQVAVVGEGSRVHYRNVDVGRDYGTDIEILSGLNDGEEVIVNPTDDVREGSKVKITKPKGQQGDRKGAASGQPKGAADTSGQSTKQRTDRGPGY